MRIKRGPEGSNTLSRPQTLRLYSADTGYQTASLGNLFGLPYVVMRKPEPIDTTTLNYNWQVWNTNAFSVYTKETDAIDEQSAQEAVAAVLRYLSRVGLLRYNCHSGYLSSVVQENEMANVLTPAGGIFRRFVEPGQEVEYGQKLGVILDPFTAEVQVEITCPTSGVVFFALKKAAGNRARGRVQGHPAAAWRMPVNRNQCPCFMHVRPVCVTGAMPEGTSSPARRCS